MQPPELPVSFVVRRKIPVPPAPQPASAGMNFPAALCTRHRKITQGCSTWGKDLEHNMPWFQPDHPGVQETNPSHVIALKSKTMWSWFNHKVKSPCWGDKLNIGTSDNGDNNNFFKKLKIVMNLKLT